MTVSISLLAILLGTVLGIVVGLALVYGGVALRLAVRALFGYHAWHAGVRAGAGLLLCLRRRRPRSSTPFSGRCVRPLTLFCGSHVGEIVRGALQAFPKGQIEAAKAIGLTFTRPSSTCCCRRRCARCLPAWVNTAAEMVKASTLLSVIGVAELLLRTQQIIARNFMSLQFYFFAGCLYFLINYAIEHSAAHVERRLPCHPERVPRWPSPFSTSGSAQEVTAHEVLKGVDLAMEQGDVVSHDRLQRLGQDHLAALREPARRIPGRQIMLDGEEIGYTRQRHNAAPQARERDRPPARDDRHGVPAVQPVPAHDARCKTSPSACSR